MRHLWIPVAHSWLLAIAALLAVLPAAWALARARASAGLVCCLAYVLLEVTACCVELAWSRCGLWRFCLPAVPLALLHAAICLNLLRRDFEGCFLVSALLLGLREALFEFLFCNPDLGVRRLKERAVTALVGGFAHGTAAAALCGGAFLALRTAERRAGLLGDGMLALTYVLALPAARVLARMLTTFLASAAALALWPRGGREASGPPLDGLVLYADLAFTLGIFVELPYAVVLLVVPKAAIFWCAVIANAVLDVAYAYSLDALQAHHAAAGDAASGGAKERGDPPWAPTYCISRPTGVVAVLVRGGSLLGAGPAGEAQPLLQRSLSGTSTGPDWTESLWPVVRGLLSDGRPSVPAEAAEPRAATPRPGAASAATAPAATAAGRGKGPPGLGEMSPRVSRLLDEYDEAVIGTSIGSAGRGASSPEARCRDIFLLQTRRLALSTHLLANAAATAVAATFVPLLRMHLYWFGGDTLLRRVAGLLLLRLAADLAACLALGHSAGAVPCQGLWETPAELATTHGWGHRILCTACASVVVVAAAL